MAAHRIPVSSTMGQIRVTARVRVPEPLSYVHSHFTHDGRRGVALGETSGRVWLLDVDPARRAVEARPLAITVAPERMGRMRRCDLALSHAGHRLLAWSDRPRVHDLPSGEVVAEVERMPGRAFCLSPRGRWLLSLDEGLAWTMDLDRPPHEWSETGVFHQMDPPPGEAGEPEEGGEDERDEEEDEWDDHEDDGPKPEPLLLDHVDDVAAFPWAAGPVLDSLGDAEHFWLAAGCYGHVAAHLASAAPLFRAVGRVRGQTRVFGGLVYDPTELLSPWGQRHLLVRHGCGCGLEALDPATGERHRCAVRPPGQQPYGFFRGVVACGEAPIAWVSTGDGTFLWRIGERLTPMPDPGLVAALYPDQLLCFEDDELVWASFEE